MISFKSLKESQLIDSFLEQYKNTFFQNQEYLIVSFYLSKGQSYIDFGNFEQEEVGSGGPFEI